ncbi:MAG: heavy-metal-associated domain-containing protein [Candidatus Pacebacteria bacterium]|nr:heavy-metal-associated domain-containing protein [Candidatus Paceibacterota bacterium]
MLNFFKKTKKNPGKSIMLKISGMHCTSCSMNIDSELEELDGVISASTSYAKSETKVEYDQEKVDLEKIKAVIKELGYGVVAD